MQVNIYNRAKDWLKNFDTAKDISLEETAACLDDAQAIFKHIVAQSTPVQSQPNPDGFLDRAKQWQTEWQGSTSEYPGHLITFIQEADELFDELIAHTAPNLKKETILANECEFSEEGELI